MHDERTLVEAARQGDREAFGALYDQYAPLIRAVCFDLTGDSTVCHDLTQDVFLRAFSRMAVLRKATSFGAWLVGIAKNRVREWRRARKREDSVHSSVPRLFPWPADPPDEDLSDLHRVIRQLPERPRMAVRLFYLREVSALEGSQIMRISLSSFYAALAQARALLRSQMDPPADAEERGR